MAFRALPGMEERPPKLRSTHPRDWPWTLQGISILPISTTAGSARWTQAALLRPSRGGGDQLEGPNPARIYLNYPHGLAFDRMGNVYVTDSSFRLRKVAPTGVVTIFAGNSFLGVS